MDKLERITNLILVLLDAREPLSLSIIADRIGGYPESKDARKRAFERDKQELRKLKIPLRSKPIPGPEQIGYRIYPDEYYLPDLNLTQDEQVALNLALNTIQVDQIQVDQIMTKLGGLESKDQNPVAILSFEPNLSLIHEAISNKHPISFDYKNKKRIVIPYTLIFSAGHWYVTGLDKDKLAERTFRLDRIISLEELVEVVDENFYHFPIADAIEKKPWRMGSQDSIEVKILLDPLAMARSLHEIGEENIIEKKPNGWNVAKLEVSNKELFKSWILGLMGHAFIISPAELRQDIIQWLEQIIITKDRVNEYDG